MFGKRPETVRLRKKRTIMHKNSGALQYSMASAGAMANGTTANGTTANRAISNGTSDGATNHVVHPTVVRTKLPLKRKVNEVRRAATKGKRAAKSQLSRPHKKSGSKRPNGAVMSPTESEKSGPGATDGTIVPNETRVKDRLSSRFSIINFKTSRPKSFSPGYHKGKIPDKRKSKSSCDKKSKSKPSKNYYRSRSLVKKRRADGPDKTRRSSSPDKTQNQKTRSPEKHRKMGEGNWLIDKFLADEEKTAKPVVNGSLNGSLSSVNAVIGGPTSSPQMGPVCPCEVFWQVIVTEPAP